VVATAAAQGKRPARLMWIAANGVYVGPNRNWAQNYAARTPQRLRMYAVSWPGNGSGDGAAAGGHGELMLALYRSGRQGEALQAFHELNLQLGDDLGIEPGRPLYQQILTGEAELLPTSSAELYSSA
jgi:hypothetical protein